jgi:hypothetical protein
MAIIIQNKTIASVARKSTENRNQLPHKGDIYIGTGNKIEEGSNIPDTKGQNIIDAINENATGKTLEAQQFSASNPPATDTQLVRKIDLTNGDVKVKDSENADYLKFPKYIKVDINSTGEMYTTLPDGWYMVAYYPDFIDDGSFGGGVSYYFAPIYYNFHYISAEKTGSNITTIGGGVDPKDSIYNGYYELSIVDVHPALNNGNKTKITLRSYNVPGNVYNLVKNTDGIIVFFPISK